MQENKRFRVKSLIGLLAIACAVVFCMGMNDFILLAAIDAKNDELVKTCLRLGANANTIDKFHISALMMAVDSSGREADLNTAKTLIQHGADVNARDDFGETPLFHALRANNDAQLAGLLLANGADPNAQNRHGDTVLADVADNPEAIDLVKILIKRGSDLNIKN